MWRHHVTDYRRVTFPWAPKQPWCKFFVFVCWRFTLNSDIHISICMNNINIHSKYILRQPRTTGFIPILLSLPPTIPYLSHGLHFFVSSVKLLLHLVLRMVSFLDGWGTWGLKNDWSNDTTVCYHVNLIITFIVLMLSESISMCMYVMHVCCMMYTAAYLSGQINHTCHTPEQKRGSHYQGPANCFFGGNRKVV